MRKGPNSPAIGGAVHQQTKGKAYGREWGTAEEGMGNRVIEKNQNVACYQSMIGVHSCSTNESNTFFE